MIKFFRKIRYNLMSENKTGKYFKYAIGEIILVVIGILIALQINNWNEKRIEKKLERTTLLSLKQNLIVDSLEIYDDFDDFKEEHGIIDSIKHFYKGFNVKSLNYEDLTGSILNTYSFVSARSTFDELKASGRFYIISNKQLSDSIMNYYNFIEDRVKTFTGSVTMYARTNFAPHLLSNYQIEMDYKEDLYANRTLTSNELDRLRNDLLIKNAINYRSYMLSSLEYTYTKLINKNRVLLDMINEQLDY